jgi:hypothetical protein
LKLPFKNTALFTFLLLSLFLFSCQKEVFTPKNDYKTLGSSAHDFLSADLYQSLIIEIAYMPGNQPDNNSLDDLKTFLEKYLIKPGGISFSLKEIPTANKSILELSDIVSLEHQYRKNFTGNNRIAVFILIADAAYYKSSTLGVSYWNSSICLFGKTINTNSGGTNQISRAVLTSILFEHEFGHLLGLVGQGSPMQTNHIDAQNGAHCNNRNCLMNYAVETYHLSGATQTSPIPSLDANCLADLKANGGK